MFETITTGFIFLLFGVVAGLGVDIALKRIFELESPVDEGSSSTLPGIAEKVSDVVSQLAPISRSVMDSTRDSLDRAGLTRQPRPSGLSRRERRRVHRGRPHRLGLHRRTQGPRRLRRDGPHGARGTAAVALQRALEMAR